VQSGDIPDLVEFLADDWATALWHDRFLDFVYSMKAELSGREEIMKLVRKAVTVVGLWTS